jgi:two-component system chemotaxis response regulator CheB
MPLAARIRVLIVDDSPFSRKVVRNVLLDESDIEVVGWSADGVQAMEDIALLHPDVVTLDCEMPNLDGKGVLAAVKEIASPPAVVVVTIATSSEDDALRALGASSVIRKPTALATKKMYELASELVHAIRMAARGRGTPFASA